MKRRIRMELDDVARKRALQGYEIPRDFIIDREPFSKANHLLTDSGKPATGRLRATCALRSARACEAGHAASRRGADEAVQQQSGRRSGW